MLSRVGGAKVCLMERNWKEYNEKLVKRGDINLDENIFRNWNKELKKLNRGKEGHRFEYPDSFILFIGLLKVNFRLPYRKLDGFVSFITRFCPLIKRIPNYTTAFRRMNLLDLDLFKSIPKSNESMFISVDASGLKADHGGSWLEMRFGRKKRRWVKIHFAIDVKTKRVIDFSVTTDRVHDNRRFRGLIRKVIRKHKIDKVCADPAYDDYKNYELLHKLKIRPAIKLRSNSNPDYLQPRYNPRMFERWRQIILFKKYSFNTWKAKTGYNYRTLSESCFSSFKANYGDGVYSKKFANARQEVLWKIYAYNLSR